MNSLERDFNRIIEVYGHDILLLHSDKKTKCTCFDEITGSSDRSCPFCFGMGTVPVIEKHRVRDQDMQVPDTLPYIASQQLFGDMAVASRSYFFKKDVVIKVDDLLIDVEWNGNLPVYTDGGIYEVSHIDPQRFINGELTFQKVYVKDQPIKKSIRGFKIVQQAGKVLYQLAERRA